MFQTYPLVCCTHLFSLVFLYLWYEPLPLYRERDEDEQEADDDGIQESDDAVDRIADAIDIGSPV